MNQQFILALDDANATLDVVGGKGASLARMLQAGLPVPGGYSITTEAYRWFVDKNSLQPHILAVLDQVEVSQPATLEAASQSITQMFAGAVIPSEVAEEVVQAYMTLPGSDPAVAVRSSATAEDLPEASFAGQQETYLNISGPDAVLDAVRNCWASLWTARAISYRIRQEIDPETVALSVVVQLLVNAEVAGILFTANPLNGHRDQMLINASWGLGEAVVGGLVTPDTLVLEKESGNVIGREIGNKLVRTVRVDGGILEQKVPENLRLVPALTDKQASDLAVLGNQIEALYGTPMDVEWTLADNVFAIVQARPITALPAPEPAPPTEWKLPKGAYAAMRNNIIEMMIDPLTPLFKTMGLGAVNASYNRLLAAFMGSKDVMPEDPIIAVNEYAYYNGSVKFGPMFGIILDSVGIVKRMFTGAVERWTEEGRPRYKDIVQKYEKKDWDQLPAIEILDAIRLLTEAAIDAYGALVAGVIPAAWMSEAWFTFTYKFIKKKSDPKAPVFLMGFDNTPIRAEKSIYDLAQWTKTQNDLSGYLMDTSTKEIEERIWADTPPAGVDEEVWQIWKSRFLLYLQDYGHMIYNLDFGSPIPADRPGPILETFKMFLSGQGANPHERQQQSANNREEATEIITQRLNGRRLKRFTKNLSRAQKFAPLREDGLADVGLSYPIIRKALQALADRMVKASVIDKPEDIYWVEEDQLVQAAESLDAEKVPAKLTDVVPQSRAIWRAARKVSPPLMLPQIKLFGVDLVALKTGAGKQKGDVLKGVAASPGTVTAPACVMYGPEDFSKMEVGDVLVTSLTTPAWTPLFARASAVVTDIGGPLSHGSIVAREYGIPAVLGTVIATTRINDGQRITVDGDAGTVTLFNSE